MRRFFPVICVLLIAVAVSLVCRTGAQLSGNREPVKGPGRSSAKPLPGQIIIDPDHPQWLKRHGGKHVFICGPGDPEEFLYVGKRNPDGTRDGDQVQRIKKLIEHGGNCIYLHIVRTHGGDAKADKTQNPFVDSDPTKGLDEDILNQWEEWFTLMDRDDILIYLFFYDDSARIWNTGDKVGPEEKAFLETIVKKFKHHKNLIWIVGEESEERYSHERIQAIAEVIKNADEHGHLIGTHHLSGTTFKAWQAGSALNHFSMQLAESDDKAHAGAIEALKKAAGRYQIIYSESTAMKTDVDGMRRHAWAVAMGGLMPMLLRMDIATTPVEALQQCRYLQTFFEATDFWRMAPHDELKHAETKYVLADPGRSYIAYTDDLTGKLGIKDLPEGEYALTWMDCRTGKTVNVDRAVSRAGNHTFDRPKEIGKECAAWIRRQAPESVLIDDPLQGKTKGKQVSGSFGPEGYQPGLGQNHIFYQLPHTVREGYAEFEVKGMDAAAVPKGGDHGFLAMYDGRGVTEPAQYFRDLKSNFYRWNVHWRQDRNALKCVISCAAPGAEREKSAKTQYGEKRDWSAEPTGKAVNWDPKQWYRIRVEWKGKVFRVLINGEENWRVEGPHDYAPVDHRIWLGCAPGQGDKYLCLVKDIVYRNFKVASFSKDDLREKALYFPPPGEGLNKQARRKPGEVGLKPEVIDRLKQQIKTGRWALWRHGYLVHVEGDFNEQTEVKSLRKTWHALTVGAAIQQEKIPSLQQKVSVWNKELKGKDAEATWWHVITQTSGFDYPYGDQPAYKPGEIWTYSDKNPHQLCNALARVYGKKDYRDDYDAVIKQAYFDALGMRGWKTSIREDGIRFHLDLEDTGRLGLLVLARGRWNGKQIIPQNFVESLETKQTRGIKANYDGPDDGAVGGGWLREHKEKARECPYGYMTWVNTDGDLFPGTDRAWAQGSGVGGACVLWNHRNGIVFAGLGVDTRRGTGGIPLDIEACIAGLNPLLSR